MTTIFNRPHPFTKSTKDAFVLGLIACILIFAIFYFIKPFGLINYNSFKVLSVASQYALVTFFVSTAFNVFVPNLFPKFFQEKNYTVIKEIFYLISLISCITLGNIALTHSIFNVPFSLSLVYNLMLYTFLFGLAPIIASVLIKQHRLLLKYSAQAKQINQVVYPEDKSQILFNIDKIIDGPISFLKIIGENQNEILEIASSDFLFAESDNNYTTIYFIKMDFLKTVVFRLSLKNMELQIENLKNIFRCHKSFLINLEKTTHISGNAQGYKLHLKKTDIIIPVSRSLNGIIKQKLQEFIN